MVLDTQLDFLSSITSIEDIKQVFLRVKNALQLIGSTVDQISQAAATSNTVFYHMQASSATLGLTSLSLKLGDVAVTAAAPQIRVPYNVRLRKISWCVNHGTVSDPGDWNLQLWQAGSASATVAVPVSMKAVAGLPNTDAFVVSDDVEIALTEGSLWFPTFTGGAADGVTAHFSFFFSIES